MAKSTHQVKAAATGDRMPKRAYDYHEVTGLPLKLPKRPASKGHERPRRDTQNYVPDHAAEVLR